MLKIYRSSAGSGKTFTLVKEYLRICIQSKDATKFKHILAITFTNKAANEMKERVLHTLEDFADGCEKENHMMELLVKETSLSKEQIIDFSKVMLGNVLQDYSSLSIKTIDSFIQMVLRNFSYELELPRNFEVQLDRDTLLDAMVENLMNEINGDENNLLAQALVQFAEEKMDDGKGWRIEQNIRAFANRMMQESSLPYLLQLKDIDYDQIEEVKSKLQATKQGFEKSINDVGKNALALIKKEGLSESVFYYKGKGIVGYFTKLSNFPMKTDIEQNSYTIKTLNEDKWNSSEANDTDKSKIDSIKQELHRLAELSQTLIAKNNEEYVLADLVLRNMYIYKIADGLNKALEKFKMDENVLPIQESQPLISQIVSQQDAPIIYERIGEKYDSILIDEFQDTSLLQFRNLLPLIENSQYKSEDSLIVGDAKQSIYRFKGGEAEQLMQLPYILGSDDNLILKEREVAINNYPTQLLALDQNFRSLTNIIDFNNKFYDSLKSLSPSLSAIYHQHEQKLNPLKTGGFVAIEAIEKGEDGEDEKLNRIIVIIEESIAANYSLGDIAILVRGNRRGSQIAAYLLENGYTVETNESLFFTESKEVRLLLAAMHFIAKPFDSLIRYELLTNLGMDALISFEKINALLRTDIPSFLSSISETKELHIHFNELRNLSTSMLLDKLVMLFNLDVSDIFVASFLDLIAENNKHFKNGLVEFFEWWEVEKIKKSIDNTSGANAIKISTIHKSKGLQYPIVILSDADWKISSNDGYHWIENDDSIGISPVLINHTKRVEETKYAHLYQAEVEKQMADALNLLYVATTRAEDRLYMLYEQKESKSITTVSDFIIHFKGDSENYVLGEKSNKVVFPKNESKPIEAFHLTERYAKCVDSPALSIHPKSFDSKEIEYGNVLHELLLLTTQSNIEFAIKAIKRYALSEEDSTKLVEDISYICSHDLLKEIYNDEYILIGESEVIEANDKIVKPDLIAIHKVSKKVTIIDYKTGKADQKHLAQIANYATLLVENGKEMDKKYIVYTQSKRSSKRMKTFLQTVADYTGQKVEGNWETTTFIFPNNRSCYYFKELLKESLPKGTILPEIITLEHFSMRYTLLQKADNIDLSLNLFKTYKQFFPEISFQQFLPISQNLLTDFSELESELMDIDLFFRNLQQLKSMNVYMEEDEEKAFRYKYFWQCVEQCYRNLKTECNQANSGFSGMLYRNAAENIATIHLPNRHYFVVGFTQLSEAEASVVKYILDTQKAEYLVDTDAYYIHDKQMTAGISYRKNFKRLGIKEPKFIGEEISALEKEINIYPCNGKQEQVQTIYSLIQQLELPTENHTDTAILLPDPSMLQPLIAQLPERYKDANISMGLSMSNASVYRLLSSLQQCLHYAKTFNDEAYFYIKSLIKFIENPLLQAHQNLLGELIKMSEKSVYISIKNVSKRLSNDDLLNALLLPNNGTSIFGESLHHFVSNLRATDLAEHHYIDITLDLIANINQKSSLHTLLTIDDYLMLLLDQISNTEIPFDVNPKKGLQIMGIRESRNLDFKNVFILSMNEGVFPSSSKGNSYIPIEIRMAYLTPPIEKDAISSYLFYRLLHRSEKLFLLYNQQVKVSGGGELSRFIIQTKIALKHQKNIRIKEWEVKSNWVNPTKPETIIQKNQVTLAQVKHQLTTKGISPSGLNVFVNCSLQYYYKYIVGLRNKDEAAETIEADLLGSTVHHVIEKLFEPHINSVLTKEVINAMKKGNQIEKLVQAYLEENFDTKLLIGQNYLLAKVAEKLIRMFLNQESDFVSNNNTTIIQQEDELIHHHTIDGVEVKFKGFADRIDVVNDVLRIVDYKTGKDSSLEVKEDKWDEVFSDPKKSKTLQVLLYAWLYKKSKGTSYPISSGIYWLKKSKDNFDAVKINKEEILSDDILENVETSLTQLVSKILNPDSPFCMTEDENRCQYCDFKTMCAR